MAQSYDSLTTFRWFTCRYLLGSQSTVTMLAAGIRDRDEVLTRLLDLLVEQQIELRPRKLQR